MVSHEKTLYVAQNALEESGFEIDWIGYNSEYNAIVVEYLEPVGMGVQNMFLDHVPKLAGALTGCVRNEGDPDIHERLITFIADDDTSSGEPTGLRWRIEGEWAQNASRTGDVETLFHRVGETMTAIDEDGAHNVDVTFAEIDMDI